MQHSYYTLTFVIPNETNEKSGARFFREVILRAND